MEAFPGCPSSILDSHAKEHINSLEAIQRRAARFTTQDFGRTSSVSLMLEDPGWLTLKESQRDIRLYFQIIMGKVAVPVENILERAHSRTRSSHNREYRQLPTNSTQYLHSFFHVRSLSGIDLIRPTLTRIPFPLLRPYCVLPHKL